MDRILLQRESGPANVDWARDLLIQYLPNIAPSIRVVSALEEIGTVLLLVPTAHTQAVLGLSGLDLGDGDRLSVTLDPPIESIGDLADGDGEAFTASLSCPLPPALSGTPPTGRGVTLVLLDTEHVEPLGALEVPGSPGASRVAWFRVTDTGVNIETSPYVTQHHATMMAAIAAGTRTGYATSATIWSFRAESLYQVAVALRHLVRSHVDGPLLFCTAIIPTGDAATSPRSPVDRMIDWAYASPPVPHPGPVGHPPAARAEIACVVAAGNMGEAPAPSCYMRTPATATRAMTVGAWHTTIKSTPDSSRVIARSSSLPPPGRTDKATLLAHINCRTATTGDEPVCAGGTSMAAAFVAGTLVLWLELRPCLRPREIMALWTKPGVCIHLDSAGTEQGAGALDAAMSIGVIGAL